MASRTLLPFVASLALAAVIAPSVPWVVAGDGADSPATQTGGTPKVRREGTQLRDEPGRFLTSGNRTSFVAADGANYIVLENLNLERVAKVVSAGPDVVEWFASGTVTEYQGSNYLLLSHIRRKATTPKTPRGF